MKKISIAATSGRAGRIDILGIGGDNQMYHNEWEGAWGKWEAAGGALTSSPSVVSHSAPTASSPGPQHSLEVFAVGADNQLYRNHYETLVRAAGPVGPTIPLAGGGSAGAGASAAAAVALGTWRGWQSIGGVLASQPAVVSWGVQRFDSFYLGSDRQLWHNWWDGAASGSDALGGLGTSPPAAVSWGPNRLDIFVLGLDKQMYHKSWSPTGWSPSATGWEALGGPAATGGPSSGGFNSQPAVVSWGPNRLDVFALSNRNSLWHKAFDGAWHDWEDLGGICTSPPSVVSWAPGRLDVFATGTDDQMYHNWYSGGWGGWEPLGGAFTTAPAAVSWGANRLDVFGLGTDRQMYHNWFERGWGGWEPLGGAFNIPKPNCAQVDFVLGGFYLHDKRSNRAGQKDSVKVAVSLTVDNVKYPDLYCDYGDIGDTNRWYGLLPGGAGPMGFPAVIVKRDSQITLSFAMANAGHTADQDKVKDSLTTGTDKLIDLAKNAAPGSDIWGPIAKWLGEHVIGWILANCDGPVAGDVFRLSGGDILDQDWVSSKGYVGVDSPAGCGSNSNYHVVMFARPHGNWGLKSFLLPGERLPTGSHLVSRSGDFTLEMQTDGNLVAYYARALNVPTLAAQWATGTNGHTITRCEMQTDGNFVLYEGTTPVFATNTNGHPGAYAAIQDDGNFVIYGPDSRPLYPSNTNWCVDSA